MKKIIKHGTLQPIKYYFVCKHCGCEFEMTNKDLQAEQQSLVFINWSNCPECNAEVEGWESR